MTNGGQKRYSDEQFIQAVKKLTPASTSEVAKDVGCTRRNADIRLKELADQGRIRRKKIAATQVWTYLDNK